MILVREVFQLKFGKAKDAKALIKEGAAIEKKHGGGPSRFLTDVTGPYYTLVMESTFNGLADFEKSIKEVMADKDWSKWYQKFIPLIESGHREIFTIVE
jgi:hypothetical protein